MSADFLTIPEASKYSGKPEITIRRMIKRVSAAKNSDSQLIKKQKKGKRFVYMISKKILQKEFGIAEVTEVQKKKKDVVAIESEHQPDNHALSSMEKTIAILQTQLEVKDRQLEKMQELVRNEQVLSLQQGRGKRGVFGWLFGKSEK